MCGFLSYLLHVLGVAITQTIHKCQSRLINFKWNCRAIEFVRSAVGRWLGQSGVCLGFVITMPAGHQLYQPTPGTDPTPIPPTAPVPKPNPSQFKLNLKPNEPKHLGQSDNQFAESTKCVCRFFLVLYFCCFFEKLHLIVKQNGKQQRGKEIYRRYVHKFIRLAYISDNWRWLIDNLYTLWALGWL